MGRTKLFISILILLVVALHAVPLLHAGLRKTMWPFMVWSMYKNSRPAGPIKAYKRRIIGITAKGQRERVTGELLGSSGYSMRGIYAGALAKGDSSVAQDLFRRLNRVRKDPFVELHLESESYTVADTGVVKQRIPVLIYRPDSLKPR
jgi:hypothetical protein